MKKRTKTIQRVLARLQDGAKHSAIDLAIHCCCPDPRSEIRHLRNAGIEVRDEWCETDESKYKVYWATPTNSLKQ